MRAVNRFEASLLLVLLAPLPVAHAQPNYRGTYASDCAKQQEASVIIKADDVIVLRTATGAQTLKLVENHPGFYGRLPPPPGFVTALLTEDASGKGLDIEVFESSGAMTIKVSGHPDVEKSLPASLRKNRVPRCDGQR